MTVSKKITQTVFGNVFLPLKNIKSHINQLQNMSYKEVKKSRLVSEIVGSEMVKSCRAEKI